MGCFHGTDCTSVSGSPLHLPPLQALQVIITFAGIISLVQAVCRDKTFINLSQEDLQLTTVFTKTSASKIDCHRTRHCPSKMEGQYLRTEN